jgi:antitoxin component YwqK of YwqJK toxin-antitoxin module
MFELPPEIIRLIYEFDPTYRSIYSHVIRSFEYAVLDKGRTRVNHATGHHQHLHNNRIYMEYYMKHSQLHGPYIIYDHNNHVFLRCRYTHGHLDGLWETFHSFTGAIKTQKMYNNNRIVSSNNFYDDGTLFSTTSYKNGKRHGLYVAYHKDGTIREECYYRNDKKI